MSLSSERDHLKMVYQEIIDGSSPVKDFFVKHLSDVEFIDVTRKRLALFQKYKDDGIPTEEERLKVLRDSEEWTDQQESDIMAYRLTIADNEKSLISLIPEQQVAIQQLLNEHKQSLRKLLIEKRNLIGATAEECSERDSTAFLTFLSIFKDRECSRPMFSSWTEFEALPEEQIEMYTQAMDEVLGRIHDLTIRTISALPFFLNAFSYTKENVSMFVNRPVSRLTNYQIHLFSLGIRNLNILTQAEGSPPEYFDEVHAEEIIKWYDIQYSMILGKRKQAQAAQGA